VFDDGHRCGWFGAASSHVRHRSILAGWQARSPPRRPPVWAATRTGSARAAGPVPCPCRHCPGEAVQRRGEQVTVLAGVSHSHTNASRSPSSRASAAESRTSVAAAGWSDMQIKLGRASHRDGVSVQSWARTARPGSASPAFYAGGR
jgi:hypothetical protein